jgi:xanthine dehydrogenase accessory factor
MDYVLILGCGDIGSAVAHQLKTNDCQVIISDIRFPAHARCEMGFVNSFYDDTYVLDGIKATYVDVPLFQTNSAVLTCSIDTIDIMSMAKPIAVIDARMSKRSVANPPTWWSCGAKPLLIGLGPGFTSAQNCDFAIETARGEFLGTEVIGSTKLLDGDPLTVDGLSRERIVYAPNTGVWQTVLNVGDAVIKGDEIGYLDKDPVRAPATGILRGISRNTAHVTINQKIIEVDPSQQLKRTGIGERPLKVAKGVIQALKKRHVL